MSAGPGYEDGDGAWIVGEDDPAAPQGMFSELLNRITRSVKTVARNVAIATLGEQPAIVEAAADLLDTELTKKGVMFGGITPPTSGDPLGGTLSRTGRIGDNALGPDGHFRPPMYAYAAVKVAPTVGKLLGFITPLSAKDGSAGTIDKFGRQADDVLTDKGRFTPAFWARAAVTLAPLLDQVGGVGSTRRTQRAIACFGDSLTASIGTNWPAALGTRLGVPVFNGGVSGQRAEHIAVRQGGLRLYLTLEGGGSTLLGTAGDRNVTVAGPDRSFGIGSNDYLFPGSWGGVHGILTQRTSDGGWHFRRDSTGAAAAVPPGTPFVSDAATWADAVQIIWAGRNNLWELPDSFAHVAEDTDNMTGLVETVERRFMVLSVTNRTDEPRGSARYEQLVAHNARNAAEYGVWADGGRYYDLRSWLVNSALAFMGLTPTADDTADIALDKIPRQLMVDETHFKPATYLAIADHLADLLTERDWI